MPKNISPDSKSQTPQTMPLRAVVEIISGELKVFPVADSDIDAQRIMDALRFVTKGHAQG